MLNLYKNLLKRSISKSTLKSKNTNTVKNYPSSIREWNNSIYNFNKNYLSFIPEAHNITIKLIINYFNLYNNLVENKLRNLNFKKRFKKLTSNKIYVNNGTFKHTNDKVIITLYVYNRQKTNYMFNLKRKIRIIKNRKINEKIILVKKVIKNYVEELKKGKSLIIKDLQNNDKNLFYKNYNELCFKYYKYGFYNNILKKYRKLFQYKQLLFINKSKFNYNYLTYLTFLLKKIYNKNIQFNIINLKYFYLNSDIFTESLLLKIKRNRKAIIKKLKHLIMKSKISQINKFIAYKFANLNKLNLNSKDTINHIVLNNTHKKKSVKKTILNLIKYKKVTGVRIEAKGRLTKRFTASKSITKTKYKGNLVNADTSYLGLSSVLLKGHLKGNIQHTKLNSKTRIGSFGLKGWISGN